MQLLKTTLTGGFLVLMPLLVLYLMVSEVLDLVVGLATPLADLLPEGTLGPVEYPHSE